MTVAAGPAAVPVRHVEHCMGTVFSVHVAGRGIERSALDEAMAWLHRMDEMFSTYRSDSEISALDAGRLRLADAAPEVRYVLAECERYRVTTDGYFDAHPDTRHLDPSGYVKGWAIQHVSDLLAAAGSTDHCINGGGDVICLGRPAPDRQWRIGISDPHRPGQLARVVSGLGPLAVATSGPAERGAHIFDPHTGRPATGTASATVVTANLVTADVYATAAVAMGAKRAESWLRSLPGVRAVLHTSDGRAVEINW